MLLPLAFANGNLQGCVAEASMQERTGLLGVAAGLFSLGLGR